MSDDVKVPGKKLKDMSLDELQEMAMMNDIVFADDASKKDIIKLIEASSIKKDDTENPDDMKLDQTEKNILGDCKKGPVLLSTLFSTYGYNLNEMDSMVARGLVKKLKRKGVWLYEAV